MELYAEENGDESIEDAELLALAVEQLRILSAEGERFLFKRLNFLRFRASALQATQSSGKCNRKTAAEINRLIEESQDTRNQIAVANLRLIRSIAGKLSDSREEFEEFCSEANTILLKSIDKFDYSRGFRFSTYATHSVQRHLRRLILRKQQERSKMQSIDAMESCESNPLMSSSDERKLFGAVAAIIESFDRVLDSREKQIVVQRFGLEGDSKGKSMKVIGDQLGLSKERVRQLLQASLEKLAEVARPLELSLGDEPIGRVQHDR